MYVLWTLTGGAILVCVCVCECEYKLKYAWVDTHRWCQQFCIWVTDELENSLWQWTLLCHYAISSHMNVSNPCTVSIQFNIHWQITFLNLCKCSLQCEYDGVLYRFISRCNYCSTSNETCKNICLHFLKFSEKLYIFISVHIETFVKWLVWKSFEINSDHQNQ